MMHQSGDLIKQRYRIVSRLGEGGTGITYQVIDEHTQQPVVLKTLVLRQASHWKMIELFEREAQILQQLNHPNIPKYLDDFVVDHAHDRTFYLVQELAPGKSLFDWVQEGWRGTEAEIQEIALQILTILDYLHQLNSPVFHRDIKPQNLMRRADGQIFLVDFGSVGSVYHNTVMRGSTMVGTYGYMAPEQFRGQVVAATDLYGLGTTLLFLLTRRSPAELPVQKLKIEFRSHLHLSNHFADWLERLLEPAIKDRFPSAQVAISELHRSTKNFSYPKLLLPLGATSILLLLTLPIVDNHRYTIANRLGLTQSAYTSIDFRELTIQDYLNKGGDPNSLGNSGLTLVHLAIVQNDLEQLKQVIAKGGNLQIIDPAGQTLLHYGAQAKPELLEYLLALNQLDIRHKSQQGKMAISHVNSEANANIFVQYITRSALPNVQKQQLLQELKQHAIKQGWLMLAYNLPVSANDTLVLTITQTALEKKDPTVFRAMIAKKQKLTLAILRQIHFYELAHASLQPQEILQLLPQINAIDRGGNTLLNFLVSQMKSPVEVQVIGQLIQQGADVNQPNLQGLTPLLGCLIPGGFSGMEQAQEAVAIALIRQGAAVNYRVPPGDNYAAQQAGRDTALDLAQSQRVRQVLRERGAKTRLELDER